MKALKGLIIAIVMVLVATTSFAADSATLNMTATVQGTCSFAAASTLLDFGTIDPTAGTDATASTSIDYTCTNGVVYTLTLPAAGSITDGTDTIGVNIAYADGGGGSGSGVPATIVIDGTIPAANFATVGAGVYNGFVTLDVSP